MNKEGFLNQCGELRQLADNILKEVDNYQSRVVKKRPEYRLYGNGDRQFCQISALKKCLKVEIKRGEHPPLKSYMKLDLLRHDNSRPNRPFWQRFYVKEEDAVEIIRLIKLGSKDWVFIEKKKLK